MLRKDDRVSGHTSRVGEEVPVPLRDALVAITYEQEEKVIYGGDHAADGICRGNLLSWCGAGPAVLVRVRVLALPSVPTSPSYQC